MSKKTTVEDEMGRILVIAAMINVLNELDANGFEEEYNRVRKLPFVRLKMSVLEVITDLLAKGMGRTRDWRYRCPW